MELEVTAKIEKRDEDEIFQGLLAYNLPRLEDKGPRDLGVYLLDGEGRLQGGLTGATHGNWLFVKSCGCGRSCGAGAWGAGCSKGPRKPPGTGTAGLPFWIPLDSRLRSFTGGMGMFGPLSWRTTPGLGSGIILQRRCEGARHTKGDGPAGRPLLYAFTGFVCRSDSN